MNTLLKSELDWIDNHPEYYNDACHQEQVKRNICTRYRLNAMLNKLNSVLE